MRVERRTGVTYSPAMIFLYSDEVLACSKGKKPQIMAKRVTPVDHTSTGCPTYPDACPARVSISGAA